MKAKEILKQYNEKRRDFRGENLRGQSFKKANLAGADFSGADIRGANFAYANLKEAKFCDAQAGLQRRWVIVLLISSGMLVGVSDFFLNQTGGEVRLIFESSSTESAILSWMKLIILAILLFVIFCKGLVAIPITISGAVVGAGAIVIVGAIFSAKTVAFTASLFVGAVAGAGAIAVAAGGVGAVGFAVLFAISEGFTIIGCIVGWAFSLIVGIWAVAGISPVAVAADSVASILMIFSGYIGWRAIQGDERDAWIRGVAIVVAAIGGTSFRHADLTDADFTFATLKNTDLREANLTRTCFYQAQRLDLVRPGKTYLQDADVRQLLVTREGQGQNFDRKNLRGVNLKWANLTDASFISADLSEANLQEAILVQTKLDYANLTGATLKGAYVQALQFYYNRIDDSRLIAIAVQQFIENHPEAKLDISVVEVSIEDGKACDKIFIRIATQTQVNLSEFENEFFTIHKDLQALSSTELEELLMEKDKKNKELIYWLEDTLRKYQKF